MMQLSIQPSSLDVLLALRVLVNCLVAYAVASAGVRLYRTSQSSLAPPIMVMLLLISGEIVLVTGSLFLSEWYKHLVAIIARLVEGGGVGWFFYRLGARNGKHGTSGGE